MDENDQGPPRWQRNVQAITHTDAAEFRPASQALIADRQHHEQIVAELLAFVEQCAKDVLYFSNGGLRVPAAEDEQGNRLLRTTMTRQQAAIQTILGIVGPARLLDEQPFLQAIDYSGMLSRLGEWPRHIGDMRTAGIEAARQFKARYPGYSIEKIQVFGVGGSAAPHDLVAEIASNFRRVGSQIEVIHADTPNADFTDEHTLAILASFSGSTEEMHHCYHTIKDKGCYFVALTEGGELAELAQDAANRFPLIQLPQGLVKQPRESVCLQMTGLLAFLASIDLPGGSQGKLTLESLDFDAAQQHIADWRKDIGCDAPSTLR